MKKVVVSKADFIAAMKKFLPDGCDDPDGFRVLTKVASVEIEFDIPTESLEFQNTQPDGLEAEASLESGEFQETSASVSKDDGKTESTEKKSKQKGDSKKTASSPDEKGKKVSPESDGEKSK